MNSSESDLLRLSSFPEQNPNPVIEVSLSGEVTYSNPAANKYFPDINEKGLSHPLLKIVKEQFNQSDLKQINSFTCEITVNEKVFEQKLFYISTNNLIRVYSSDLTEQKKIQFNLSRLASFPEKNPSPIIEINLSGIITYINPACKQIFPELQSQKLEHPILANFMECFGKLKNGEIENYVCEIRFKDHYYSQRARLMPENKVIRIFNNDVTQQKLTEQIIREKNKDITDSINYAKKIQQSILPSHELVPGALKDYFILYQPKDIISGDFYWYTYVEDYFLFACADCTGHGVPGALMSMIGSNFISTIVIEKKITRPEGALTELDKRVRKALKQDEEPENRDGMDIAFCSMNINKKILHYAGANRPLVIIRNGELKEYSPTKSPIGGQHHTDKVFAGNKIELQSGDCIYLFSDGITDQFGGEKGKKFMKKRFYDLMLSNSKLKMNEQRLVILKAFENWKGKLEQTDDVCVLGIRVP